MQVPPFPFRWASQIRTGSDLWADKGVQHNVHIEMAWDVEIDHRAYQWLLKYALAVATTRAFWPFKSDTVSGCFSSQSAVRASLVASRVFS